MKKKLIKAAEPVEPEETAEADDEETPQAASKKRGRKAEKDEPKTPKKHGRKAKTDETETPKKRVRKNMPPTDEGDNGLSSPAASPPAAAMHVPTVLKDEEPETEF